MEKKHCSNCGQVMNATDRFCANCGFDNESYKKESGNKNAIVIVSSLLVMILLVGGILAFWFSKKDDRAEKGGMTPEIVDENKAGTAEEEKYETENEKDQDGEDQLDLSLAQSYLPQPGTILNYFSNYVDGQSGYVKKVYGQAVPDESIILTEVEILADQGQENAFCTHYVLRPDGLYLIYDDLPYEIEPVLKNDMKLGTSWVKTSEYGDLVWTVMDVGISLDLGFQVFDDCIIVRTDNQAVDVQTLIYYAPGVGMVYQVSPEGGHVFYKLTSIEQINSLEAKSLIQYWATNYLEIKDDRRQSV